MCIRSNSALEILLFSVNSESLKDGVSNLLCNDIYYYANSQKIKYINWQRSSSTKVSIFKQKWKAKKITKPIFYYLNNKKAKQILSKSYLDNLFEDIYIYPFSKLE